jgi:DNA-binding XRE family transcriptional regulator
VRLAHSPRRGVRAIRDAILLANRLRRRERLRAEALELAHDPVDQAEIRAVREEMDAIHRAAGGTNEEDRRSRWTTWDELRDQLGADPERVANYRAQMEAEITAYRLAEIRKEQALTQDDVADAMGVSQKRVSEIESADLARTEVSTIRRYVEALGGRVRIVADFPGQTLTIQ